MIIGACDIFEKFILRQDLTLAENILLNYLILTKDKAKAIGMAMNFLSRSAVQRALVNLVSKYSIIFIDLDGKVTLLREFSRHIVNIPINNTMGRPRKLAQANMQ